MNAAETGAWIDFAQLSRTKAASRATGEGAAAEHEAALRGVARQFESVFMNMMLKSMRSASSGDPLFDSSEGDSYREMFDQQLSLEMSKQGGIGIADMLVRQLSPLVRQAAGAQTAPDPFISFADQDPIVPLDGAVAVTTPATQQQADSPPSLPGARGAEPVAGAPVAADLSRQDGDVLIGRLRQPGPPAEVRPLPVPGQSSEGFDGPEDFVARTWPHAERVAEALGIEPAVLVAQAALETGWGRHVMSVRGGDSSHNLFGIKADQRWQGPSVTAGTLEFEDGVLRKVQAPFRSYDSVAASFEDYAHFVGGQNRYQGALDAARAAGGDGETYIRHLHQAGYATDPDYADKVVDVMRRTVAAVKNTATQTL